MKKELPVGAVIGILAAIVVVVGFLAWKLLIAPNATPPVRFTKEMSEEHNKSAELIRQDQARRAAARRSGQ
jgi:hypothetical protein